ncbi:hypothetical protein [Nocardioides daphniae]|nr:hypothetical protein [Nocardioides daphniae]
MGHHSAADRLLHRLALTSLTLAWLAWGHGLFVAPRSYELVTRMPIEEWRAAADLTTMFPFWVASLIVLAYVPLAALELIPVGVTAVVSSLTAWHLWTQGDETTFLVRPGLEPPLVIATALAAAAGGLAAAAVLWAVVRSGWRSGQTLGALPQRGPVRLASLLVVAAWVGIAVVAQLAPRVRLAPEDDIEPGTAFGITVLVHLPFILATLWIVPTCVLGAAGRMPPIGVALNAVALLVASLWVRSVSPQLHELIPTLRYPLEVGMAVAVLALLLLLAGRNPGDARVAPRPR